MGGRGVVVPPSVLTVAGTVVASEPLTNGDAVTVTIVSLLEVQYLTEPSSNFTNHFLFPVACTTSPEIVALHHRVLGTGLPEWSTTSKR